jgi:hypothetical protein
MLALLLLVRFSKSPENHKQSEFEQMKERQKKFKISKINAIINKINEKASTYYDLGKTRF